MGIDWIWPTRASAGMASIVRPGKQVVAVRAQRPARLGASTLLRSSRAGNWGRSGVSIYGKSLLYLVQEPNPAGA